MRSKPILWGAGCVLALSVVLFLLIHFASPPATEEALGHTVAPRTGTAIPTPTPLQARMADLEAKRAQSALTGEDIRLLYRQTEETFETVDAAVYEWVLVLAQEEPHDVADLQTIFAQLDDALRARILEALEERIAAWDAAARETGECARAAGRIRSLGAVFSQEAWQRRADALERFAAEKEALTALAEALAAQEDATAIASFTQIPPESSVRAEAVQSVKATLENERANAQNALHAGDRVPALRSAERIAALVAGMGAPELADWSAQAELVPLLERCRQPDYSWLGTARREQYTYQIVWDLMEYDPLRPTSLQRMKALEEADKARMEKWIFEAISLYPPDYANRYIHTILCYSSYETVLMERGQPILDDAGALRWEKIYGASSNGYIILTDQFDSQASFVRALVHEIAHIELSNGEAYLRPDAERLLENIRNVNASDFQYYFERAEIHATSDIPGWRSTDETGDWQKGFARRYGMLEAEEDYTTVSEKLLLGKWKDMQPYPLVVSKLNYLMAFRQRLHPSFTAEFFTKLLPEYLAEKGWYS